MKKSLLALAVLGAFAGVASAQSSVTVFGVVDAAARNVKNSGSSSTQQLASGGWNTSRLGFRGVEDLGGGLKAGFWLEHGLNVDTGAQSAGAFWNRRSTVSLLGSFGEVRLGHDYSPNFWQVTGFDVFNYGGIGGISNLLYAPNPYSTAASAGGAPTATTTALNSGAMGTRNVDNGISYFLPSGIGGVYGQFTAAAPEGNRANKYYGGRVGYAGGPLDVSALYSQTDSATPGASRLKAYGLGGSYDFGVAKVLAQYLQQKASPAKQSLWEIATVVPLGLGEIHASYVQSKLSGTALLDPQDAKQFALGYAYNLSKRTALYGNIARLDNGGNSSNGAVLTVASGGGPITPGGNSTGYEVGIRHSF